MANTKISAFPVAAALGGTELVPMIQAGADVISTPAALSTYLASTTQTLTNKTLTAPTINGGTATALTGLAIRSTGAAFDLTMATSEVLTAGRTLSWVLGDAARTISLGGNITTAGAFVTSGAFSTTLTATATTNVTLPTGGTLAAIAGSTTQLFYNNAGAMGAAAALTYATSGNLLTVAAQAATDVPLTVTGAAAQSAHLFDVTQKAGTAGGLFCVDASGKVGIGTTSPTSQLTVGPAPAFETPTISFYAGSGNITVVAIGADTSGKTFGRLSTSLDTGGAFVIQSYLSQGSVYGNLLLNSLGGNVGIGTTSPIVPLDVAGTLTLRNGGTAGSPVGQTFRAYNFYADASNYAHGFLDAGVTTANTLTIGTTGLGTGATTLSKFALAINGTTQLDYGKTTANTWTFVGSGGITTASTTLHTTSVALTNGAGASAGTLTNAPAVGNPTKWIPINDNGTTRFIPAW